MSNDETARKILDQDGPFDVRVNVRPSLGDSMRPKVQSGSDPAAMHYEIAESREA